MNEEQFPSYEFSALFEGDGRPTVNALRTLWEMSRDDATVSAFFTSWRMGSGTSFEETVCNLAVKLVEERDTYKKMALELSALQPPQPIVINGEELTPIKTTEECK